MQKVARVISILALLVISFTSVSPAFAQTEALIEDQPERPLRDYVTAAFAAALNELLRSGSAGEAAKQDSDQRAESGTHGLSLEADGCT